ncbi:MAG: menaquinone biosynthesis protein [Fimbriimonadaceae bacterium]|nr:menaquinone biosynthesis protein [Fimbriimonadaceae bacterium]
MSWRIGIVDYLNARPLSWAITQGAVPGLEPVPAVPSQLARWLVAGQIDAAIVSSIVALQEPQLGILPAAGCVSADGPVQSVAIFHHGPLAAVRRLAVDRSSVTSVALARILLRDLHGVAPELVSRPPDLAVMLADCDAALLIGDPALAAFVAAQHDARRPQPYDLGAAWRQWTGLPFVFAAWVAPRSCLEGELAALLRQARELSEPQIPAIAAAEAARLGLPLAVCLRYLRECVRFEFGARERAGFERFAELLTTLEDG